MGKNSAKRNLAISTAAESARPCLEPLEPRRLLSAVTIDLGVLPGGGSSGSSDINASGQVVGTSTRANGNERAFLWQNGVMTDLGTLGGPSNYSRAFAINDAGQVVGQSGSSTSVVAAFLLTPEDTDGNGKPDRWYRDTNSDGKNDLMRDLGTLGSKYQYAIATDVNNSGQVVGYSSISSLSGTTYRAFRWQSGVMTDLGTPPQSFANAINDAGQITGSSGSGPFLWKGGVATFGVGGTDINAAGQLVDGSRVWTPTVPNGSSGTWTTTLGQLPSVWPEYPDYVEVSVAGQSINAAGQVVGIQAETFYGENGNGYASRGVRWINSVPQELPLESASAINDAGQIAGTRTNRATLITDENLVLPLMTITGAAVTEGNSGTTNANFTVTLNRASTETVTIHYATSDGTATAGSDYTATAGTLTFAPGQTTKTISVAVIGDRIPEYMNSGEPHEFTVTLSSPVNTIVVGAAANGAIKDDEPRLSSGGNNILEGHSGSKNAMITLSLSNAYDQPVTLTYATADDTATAGSDYVATSGTLTFAPGETTRQIVVSVKGDRTPESYFISGLGMYDTEWVELNITNLSGNASMDGIGGLGIQDDEPRVTIDPQVAVFEPAIGTVDAVFTVSLSIAYDQDVIVQYATSGPPEFYAIAVAGSDYVAASGSLRIPAGQTSAAITVPVIGDGVDEDVEYFSVNLNSVSSYAAIETGRSRGLIEDFGRVKQWVGPASGGNWSTAANWRPSGAPTAADHAAIAGNSVTLGSSTSVGALTLADGAMLVVAANGNRVLHTATLSISANSKLNLNDNDLIIDYYADPEYPWSPMGDIVAKLAAGRAAAPAGIYSPQASASDGLTTLAIAEASDVLGLAYNETGSFAGQTVDATSVLIKYTYAGDANFDGRVSGDDYGMIDFNILVPGSSGYFNGDFNYDGVINGDDYGVIDFTILAQHGTL